MRTTTAAAYHKKLDNQIRIMVNHITSLETPHQSSEMSRIFEHLKQLEKHRKAVINMKPTDRIGYDIFQSKLNRYAQPVQILEYEDGNGY